MSGIRGRFTWYDLMTTDTAAAAAFYGKVVGWTAADSGLTDRSYTILSAGPAPIGGVMPIPPEAAARGAGPCWNGYVGVHDVDEVAAEVTQAGGAVHRPPEDIPGVGRFAIVGDPHGAVFLLFRGADDGPMPEAPPNTPGHVGWHELHADDLDSAFAFYSGLFGWTRDRAIEMGPMGVYQLFATGGEAVGGMMKKLDAVPFPHWRYYFNVAAIDAAAMLVTDGGGQVLFGPQEVPGGSWILQCSDPQGAMFALVAPHR